MAHWMMTRIRPQKPERPDIDDLIFGESGQPVSDK